MATLQSLTDAVAAAQLGLSQAYTEDPNFVPYEAIMAGIGAKWSRGPNDTVVWADAPPSSSTGYSNGWTDGEYKSAKTFMTGILSQIYRNEDVLKSAKADLATYSASPAGIAEANQTGTIATATATTATATATSKTTKYLVIGGVIIAVIILFITFVKVRKHFKNKKTS